MPISLSPLQMREIIMDHYDHPLHKKRPDNLDGYLAVHSNSVNCIDDIDVFLLVDDGVVTDCAFDGIACAISTASTDIMCDLVIGKKIDEAKRIIEQFFNMIYEKQYDDTLLDEAIAFQNTYKQAARIKCATIGWNALSDLFKMFEEVDNDKER